jgi:type I restriction enzyme R subunit
MRGRGTRTLDFDNLQKVSPDAKTAKTRFVIIDAIGVSKSIKIETRQIDMKPSVSMENLMMSVAMNQNDEDTLTTLAGRLNRLDVVLTEKEREQAKSLAGDVYINDIAKKILDVFDSEVTKEEDRPAIIKQVVEPFSNPKFRDFLGNVRKHYDQIIDNENIAEIVLSDWQENQEEYANNVITTFKEYLVKHRDELTALQIIYEQSYKTRPLTLAMVEELYESLQREANLSHEKLWSAYAVKEPNKVAKKSVLTKLVDIVSIIRFELGQISQLVLYSTLIDKRFKDWIFKENAGRNVPFTEEQTHWLRMIKDHIATSLIITEEALDLTPFDGNGGLGKFYQLFGQDYKAILEDMNRTLVA